DGARIADIDRGAADPRAESSLKLLFRLDRAFGIAAAESDPPAGLGERFDDRAADAATSAGDDRGLLGGGRGRGVGGQSGSFRGGVTRVATGGAVSRFPGVAGRAIPGCAGLRPVRQAITVNPKSSSAVPALIRSPQTNDRGRYRRSIRFRPAGA